MDAATHSTRPMAEAERLDRIDRRRARAWSVAKAITDTLARKDVTALVTGSLTGDRFHEASDIDFLVVDCPQPLKYAIESAVEDLCHDLPFDVIYLDEVSNAAQRASLLAKAVDVRDRG